MKRRGFATFSLSFVDAILCGFGAVILLFLIVNANRLAHRKQVTIELRSEATKLERAVPQGRRRLVELRNTLEERIQDRVRYQGLAREAEREVKREQVQLARLDRDNIARKAHINRLKSDLKSTEEGAKRLQAGASAARTQGERLRRHRGQGHRQYLTGLKINGRRTLILLDTSASMLEERLVDIIRSRNLPEREQRQAAKWRRALATLDWLMTQLPVAGKFQLYAFNEQAFAVVADTAGRWLSAGDPERLNQAVQAARGLLPEKGTNLLQAFRVAKRLDPRPDNILLITDGLPTRGRSRSKSRVVSGEQRVELFAQALEALPDGVPVNTILLPVEGDPMAAPAFWQLARSSHGAFFSPASDWP